jgi:hypothetical protein
VPVGEPSGTLITIWHQVSWCRFYGPRPVPSQWVSHKKRGTFAAKGCFGGQRLLSRSHSRPGLRANFAEGLVASEWESDSTSTGYPGVLSPHRE